MINRILRNALFVSFLFPLSAVSQINQLDKDGKKHGVWEPKYENGQSKYRGEFNHGVPVGVFTRWYDDGSLQAEMNHKNPVTSYAELYYPETAIKMAEGKYINQKRDSVWTFYSEDGTLSSKESYRGGSKNGLTEIFYPDGSISERAVFENDEKNGLWEQYFNDGHPKLKANVIDGVKYDGEYTTYYAGGKKLEQGKYIEGKKESSWYLYNEDGSIHIIYVYRDDEIEAYWDNDIQRSEYSYKNVLKNGPFKEWLDQGEWRNEERGDEYGNNYPIQKLYGTQISKEVRFKEVKLHGEVITYDSKGNIKDRLIYDMGELTN